MATLIASVENIALSTENLQIWCSWEHVSLPNLRCGFESRYLLQMLDSDQLMCERRYATQRMTMLAENHSS